jgi:hypothetical protein
MGQYYRSVFRIGLSERRPSARTRDIVIPAAFNSRMAGQAGIHFGFASKTGRCSQIKIKMDPSLTGFAVESRWDDDFYDLSL